MKLEIKIGEGFRLYLRFPISNQREKKYGWHIKDMALVRIIKDMALVRISKWYVQSNYHPEMNPVKKERNIDLQNALGQTN